MVYVLTNSLIPVMKEYLERRMIFSALALDHSQRVPPLWRAVGRVVADPEIWCEVVEVGLVYLKLTGEYSFPGNGQSPSPSHPCYPPAKKTLKLSKKIMKRKGRSLVSPISSVHPKSPIVLVSSGDERDRWDPGVSQQKPHWWCPPSPGEQNIWRCLFWPFKLIQVRIKW